MAGPASAFLLTERLVSGPAASRPESVPRTHWQQRVTGCIVGKTETHFTPGLVFIRKCEQTVHLVDLTVGVWVVEGSGRWDGGGRWGKLSSLMDNESPAGRHHTTGQLHQRETDLPKQHDVILSGSGRPFSRWLAADTLHHLAPELLSVKSLKPPLVRFALNCNNTDGA
ncbi:unnamed protein product [Pleuronectes platessa]|uniref:Uncharacterized protein n=1 Tax=Pleuronectes platessa TaxID=8262 RepID=A0A9N7TL86_PLEPL|nr:unnamed protein product [Pleuronectes platessa]